MDYLTHLLPGPLQPSAFVPGENTLRRIGLSDADACIAPVRKLLNNAAATGARMEYFYGSQTSQGKIVAGFFVASQPGKTGMVFVSSPRREYETQCLVELIGDTCPRLPEEQFALLQAMLSDDEEPQAAALAMAGFWKLADLAYMQTRVPRNVTPNGTPLPLQWMPWKEGCEKSFISQLKASYEDSRDCPGLRGLRDPRDVLSGHRVNAVFDPGLWLLATLDEKPAGIVLLNRLHSPGCAELVYLGVAPELRGRGVGSEMMRHVMTLCSQRSLSHLSLAVDTANEPALALYRKFGFFRTAKRRVLMRSPSGNPAVNSA